MFRQRANLRQVDRGAVPCPALQRDVDVERCFACSHLVELTCRDGEVEAVRCEAPPRQLVGAGDLGTPF